MTGDRSGDGSGNRSGPAVLVVPIAPARTGNGLAMRAGMLLEALAVAGPVDVVIVPVSGAAAPLDWVRAHARSIAVVDPDATDAFVSTDGAAVVVTMRTYLAPFGIELARRLGAARIVIDADDDDEALLRASGRDAEADAFARLAATWLPAADEVWAAAPAEAEALAARHHLASVGVVPNAVRAPAVAPALPGTARLLFVGNLTYAPNVDAVRVLAHDVLPRVRETRADATLDVVGPHEPGALDDVAAVAGVDVAGYVADLAPHYATADVVVVPLIDGAGTRIKILEAAAYARPVVASSAALAGLDGLEHHGVVRADGAAAIAAATLALLDDPDDAGARARASRAVVVDRYSQAAVAPVVRRGAFGEPEPVTLTAQLLWHRVTVDVADDDVRRAMEAMLPTASCDLPVTGGYRYGVEGAPGRYRVVEEADLVGVVTTPEEARDLVHLRLYRRAFEAASREGWVRLHGALVELGSTRVLVTGPSGVGKSTFALRLLLDGVPVHGDESVLLRRRESVAVGRPFHLKPGAELVVPELVGLAATLPRIDDVVVADPGRMGRPGITPWRISVAPLDHLVVLERDVPVECAPLGHTEALPSLVPQLFPVTETKGALLATLTGALDGVRCHRLGVGEPAAMARAMERAVLRELG